jgi:anti-sigma factor RsiW
MNPERPTDPREQMEVRITALLLGEASAFEESELLEAIENDPDLETYYQEMRGTIGIVEATIQSAPNNDTVEEKEQIKLDEKRRAKLQKLLKKQTREPIQLNAVPWWKRTVIPAPRFLKIAAVFAILAVLAGLFLPSLSVLKNEAIDVAFRRDVSREQSAYPAIPRSVPAGPLTKNIPTDSDTTRFRHSGSIDHTESERPWRGKIVDRSGRVTV